METHWAVHEFLAENADEISFKPGEPIVVIEKDDQYGDGWWQGRNIRGETGLFPRDYTAPDKPVVQDGQPRPPVTAIMAELQNAIDQTHPNQAELRDDASSLHDDDELASPTDYSHGQGRALLAAKAKDVLDREAQEEREAAEARRYDEERFITHGVAPPIPDLEMSDESDVEEDEPAPIPGVFGTNGRLSQPHPTPKVAQQAYYVDDDERPQELMIPEEPEQELRSASFHPGSRAGSAVAAQSTSAAPLTPQPGRSSSPGPAAASSLYTRRESAGLSTDPRRESSTSSFNPSAYGRSSFEEDPPNFQQSRFSASTAVSGRPSEGLSMHKTSQSSFAPSLGGPPAASVPSSLVPPMTAVAAGAGLAAASYVPSSPVDAMTTPVALNTPAQNYSSTFQPLTPASATSISSHARSQTVGTSTSAATTVDPASPVGSVAHKPAALSDPASWDVEQVMEWGKSKGFDQVTLAKFQEHEISGDVLLEFDLNTLKEIDLPAFGRRVHIMNAIKELKKQNAPAQNGLQSPTYSGYEPDSPSSQQFSSPRDSLSAPPARSSFGAVSTALSHSQPVPSQFATVSGAPVQQRSLGAYPTLPSAGVSPLSNGISPVVSSPVDEVKDASPALGAAPSNDMRGLGLQRPDGTGIARSESMQGSTAPSPALAASLPAVLSTPVPAYSPQSRHTRSATSETFHSITSASDTLDHVSEERTLENEKSDDVKTEPKSGVSRSGTKASRKSKTSTTEGESPVVPASPERSRFGSFTSPKIPFVRNRKAPPRASAIIAAAPSEAGSDAEKDKRRSTRLFAFGSPQPAQSPAMDARPSISAPLEAQPKPPAAASSPQPASRTVPATATSRPPTAPAPLTGSNLGNKELLDQIGKPDLSGWLRKKGDGMGQWKTRYMILKGRHLYAMKSQTEKRVKGWIDLMGYKVLPDRDSFGGNYGFKLVHSTKPAHYFSAEDPMSIRHWMKALMKSSITRDYTAPVLSSNNIATIPLAEAQAMFPPPRPPSPTSRARAQQLRLASSNPNTLTPKDAEILMSMQKPNVPIAPPRSGRRTSRGPSMLTKGSGGDVSPAMASPASPRAPSVPNSPTRADRSGTPPPVLPPTAKVSSPDTPTFPGQALGGKDAALLKWVNDRLPPSAGKATDFSTSFRSGQRILRLAESLSGRSKGIPDSRFATLVPDSDDELDIGFDVFDFLTIDLGVDTGDVSVGEMLRGDRPQVLKLVEALKAKFGAA